MTPKLTELQMERRTWQGNGTNLTTGKQETKSPNQYGMAGGTFMALLSSQGFGLSLRTHNLTLWR